MRCKEKVMTKVAVVTDGTAKLAAGLAEEYEVGTVPVKIIFEEQSVGDGIDVAPAQSHEMPA